MLDEKSVLLLEFLQGTSVLNSANHNNECAGRLQERILCSIVDTHNVLNQLIVLVRKLF